MAPRVRFARRRVGHDDVLDFVAVLFGSAISGERTLEALYPQRHPCATAFLALFGRTRLPTRSPLRRFVAARSAEPVEALRALFLSDPLARPLIPACDVDGTREAARPRDGLGGVPLGGLAHSTLPHRGPSSCRTGAGAARWMGWSGSPPSLISQGCRV
jgi:hypothetical protein